MDLSPLLLTLLAWSGASDCGPGLDNVLPNCDFAVGIEEWDGELAFDFGWEELEGHGQPGSLTMTCSAVFFGSTALSCVDDSSLAGREDLLFWADYRLESGTLSQGCSVHVTAFPEAGCGGEGTSLGGTPKVIATTDAYSQMGPTDPATAPADSQSFLLEVRCVCEVLDGTLTLDDAWLGAGLFVDDFESGDSSLWSSIVP